MSELLKVKMSGRYKVEHFDSAGKLKGTYEFPNGIVDEGMNHILNTQFHDTTAVSTWYLGLIDNAGFTALSNSDTAAQIGGTNGWAESTAYSEATRQEWTEGAASGRSITNSSTVDFSINASVTLKGIFVVSSSTKSGTTGTLWSTAAFASTVTAVNGDSLKITYTVSG